MSKLKFWKKKQKYESIDSIKSLNPSATAELSKEVVIVILPFFAMLGGIMMLPRFYYVAQDIMQLLLILGFGAWICSIGGYYAIVKSDAAGKKLHDREFGWDERHHPTYEIYVVPPDIRLLFPLRDDEKGNEEVLRKRLDEFDMKPEIKQKVLTKMGDINGKSKYMYYFGNHSSISGLDFEANQVRMFRSHIVFQDLPYDEQYCFSEGQENWYKSMLFNHPNAERDAVRPFAWVLDPFSGDPMPMTVLIHSSLKYRHQNNGDKKEKDEELEVQTGLSMFIARQHAIIEGQKKEHDNLRELLNAKLHDVGNIVDLVHSASKADIELWGIAMKAMPRGWMRSGVFKGLVTIVSIIAVAFIIVYVLNWLGYVHVFT